MQAIVLYFNELCLARELTAMDQDHHWVAGARGLAQAVDGVLAIRPESKVVLPLGSLHTNCGGSPLNVRLRQALPRDTYRRLLARFKSASNADTALEQEIRFLGSAALGLTLADVAAVEWKHGWAVSLSFPSSPWLHHAVAAQRFVLNAQGNLDGPIECTVGHLSSDDHVQHWRSEILDWGSTIASSCELAVIDGHPIVMYAGPLEHGPPHVHLLESRMFHRTIAKYRIDQFERPKGPPNWDAEMKDWVTVYREQLLRSWDRCQRGGHPYMLE